MLSVEDWAEIRRLHRAEQMPVKAIARAMGISRNTVRAAIASDRPPKYERKPAGVGRGCGRAADPGAAEGVSDDAGDGDRRADRVGPVDPGAAGPGRGAAAGLPAAGPGVSRTAYEPGEIAQCDLWFPPVMVPVGCGQVRRPAQLPVLTMVTGYARWLPAVLIPTRTAADLFAGWWQLIGGLGAVPRVLVWDGEGAIGRWRAGRVGADRELPGVPRHAGRQGDRLQARRSRGQGAGRAGA